MSPDYDPMFSEAPEEIQQIAEGAEHLPDEISVIAHKKLYGDWPDYEVKMDVPHSISFKRKVLEKAIA